MEEVEITKQDKYFENKIALKEIESLKYKIREIKGEKTIGEKSHTEFEILELKFENLQSEIGNYKYQVYLTFLITLQNGELSSRVSQYNIALEDKIREIGHMADHIDSLKKTVVDTKKHHSIMAQQLKTTVKEHKEALDVNEKMKEKLEELLSVVKSLLVQMHKINIEHSALKKEHTESLKLVNMLQDNSGFDIGQMTPRPDWDRLKKQYKIDSRIINSEKRSNFLLKNLTLRPRIQLSQSRKAL